MREMTIFVVVTWGVAIAGACVYLWWVNRQYKDKPDKRDPGDKR